jgi:hypothetical protein
MAKHAEIETAIYNDPDFLSLTGAARAVYVWSFTNQRTGQSGLYKVATEQVAMETGFSGRQLENALALLRERRFLFYDGRVMFVRTKVRRIRTKYTETIALAIASEVRSIGAHPFVRMWLDENESHPWATQLVESPDFKGNSDTPALPPSGPQVGVPVTVTVTSPVVVEEQPTQKDQLPSDFPLEAVPYLDVVHPALCDVAQRHGAKAVTRYQAATTLQTRWQHKPVVRGVYDCAGYWEGKGKRLRDVNAAYRNWLDRCDDMAAPEPLNGSGTVPLSEKQERSARRMAAFNRVAGGAA